jgi:hypothetical protein
MSVSRRFTILGWAGLAGIFLLGALLHGGGVYILVAVPSPRSAVVVRLNRWTGSLVACVQGRAAEGMGCEEVYVAAESWWPSGLLKTSDPTGQGAMTDEHLDFLLGRTPAAPATATPATPRVP